MLRRVPPELEIPEVVREMEEAWAMGLRPKMTRDQVKNWATARGYEIAGAVRLWHLMRELSGDYALDTAKVRKRLLSNEALIRTLWNR